MDLRDRECDRVGRRNGKDCAKHEGRDLPWTASSLHTSHLMDDQAFLGALLLAVNLSRTAATIDQASLRGIIPESMSGAAGFSPPPNTIMRWR